MSITNIRSAYEATVTSHTLDFRRYWKLALRHKWRVFFMMGIGALIGLALALVLPKNYEASTTLVIERPRLEASPVEAAYSFDVQTNEYFLTQFEILRSDDLAFAVYQNLDVPRHPAFHKERNGVLQELQRFILQLTPWLASSQEADPRERFETFKEALTVRSLTNTQAVRISFKSKDPKLSADVANALAQEYLQASSLALARMAGDQSIPLQTEVRAARERLQKSERALQVFREQEGLVELGSGEGLPERQLIQANERLLAVEKDYAEIKSVYDQVAHLSDAVGAAAYLASPLLAGDTQLQAARLDYEAARQEHDVLNSRYVEGHPDIQAAQMRLTIARDALVGQARTRVQAIRDQYLQAERAVVDARSRLEAGKLNVRNLNRSQFQLTELQRQVEADRSQYELLMARVNALAVVNNLAPASARVVDTAWPPLVPAGPGAVAIILLASMLSGMITLLWMFARDALNTSLRSPEDVRQRLGLPLLGYMPEAQLQQRAALAVPYSFRAEALYQLAASVQQATESASQRVLAVTSSLPEEGKTTVALSLALAQAEVCRTLLIDGSFLQPQLSRLFGCDPADYGLLEVVEDGVPLERALVWVPDSSLDLLPISRRPDNPQKLMTGPQLEALMEELSRRYDRIIIDCGPIHAVSDAILWGRKADGVVLVAEAGTTDAALIESGVAKLTACGISVTGLVLNNTKAEHSPAFADYFSNYYQQAQKNFSIGPRLAAASAVKKREQRIETAPLRALRTASED